MRLTILIVFAILLFVFFFLWISYIWSIADMFGGSAPFVPITKKVLSEVFKLAGIDDNSVFYDLGCGDGRVLAFGAQLNSQTKFIGLEKNLVPFLLSSYKNRKNQNVKIFSQNIFKRNLSDATHIYTYLFPDMMQKLLPKFKQELRPGTVVISSDFEFIGEVPHMIIDTGLTKGLGGTLYVYKF